MRSSFASWDLFTVKFTEVQDKFLEKLNPDVYILDFGCGAGRDTKYFLSRGYQVDAVDGSEQLCRIASEYTGIKVRQMLFQELDEKEKYDGIWACASILHLPKKQLREVLKNMYAALKSKGWIYTSFKYGEFEGERNGRYFTDFTTDTFKDFIHDMHGLKIEEQWITGDVRPGRGEEKMAEFTSAEKVNIGYENEYSTDAMTGGPDKRRQLYYQLIRSMKKAESVDIIVSFLMESGGENAAERTGTYLETRSQNPNPDRKLPWNYTAISTISDQKKTW